MAFIKKPDNVSICSAALHMKPSTAADRAAAAQVGGVIEGRWIDPVILLPSVLGENRKKPADGAASSYECACEWGNRASL